MDLGLQFDILYTGKILPFSLSDLRVKLKTGRMESYLKEYITKLESHRVSFKIGQISLGFL